MLLLKTRYLAFYPSLWGEDTNVFIQEALHYGSSSVFMPANGFNTLIQRLVALVVVYLPLSYAEITFHFFALAAACFTAAVVWRFSPIASVAGRLVACGALPFLPTNSLEIWFTLVNVHWYLAIALTLLVTSPLTTMSRPMWPWLIAIFLMCLSGPFSVLMVPAVVLRAIVFRDLTRGWAFYLVYAGATTIQAATVASEARGRLSAVPSDSVHAWLQGLFGNALFGFFTTETLLLIGVVTIMSVALLSWPRLDHAARFQIGAILFIAFAHVLASYYSFKQYPELIGPYMLHARYFIIPYGLGIIFLLSLGRGWTSFVTMALAIAICVAGFRPFHHIDIAPPEADRAAGAGRSPTYLPTYIDLAHHLGNVRFFGRPGLEDFVLVLTDNNPKPPPYERNVSADELRTDTIPVPSECANLRAIALIFDIRSKLAGGRVSFNASKDLMPSPSFNLWFQQFHAVSAEQERHAFAVPNRDIHTLQLKVPADADLSDGRIMCF
jgi:hypothetical protein